MPSRDNESKRFKGGKGGIDRWDCNSGLRFEPDADNELQVDSQPLPESQEPDESQQLPERQLLPESQESYGNEKLFSDEEPLMDDELSREEELHMSEESSSDSEGDQHDDESGTESELHSSGSDQEPDVQPPGPGGGQHGPKYRDPEDKREPEARDRRHTNTQTRASKSRNTGGCADGQEELQNNLDGQGEVTEDKPRPTRPTQGTTKFMVLVPAAPPPGIYEMFGPETSDMESQEAQVRNHRLCP